MSDARGLAFGGRSMLSVSIWIQSVLKGCINLKARSAKMKKKQDQKKLLLFTNNCQQSYDFSSDVHETATLRQSHNKTAQLVPFNTNEFVIYANING